MRHRVGSGLLLNLMGVALALQSAGYAQSLGDVARDNRDKQNAQASADATAQPRVITNKDLPKDPNASPATVQPLTEPSASVSTADRLAAEHRSAEQRRADQRAAQQRLAEQRATIQWRSQALAQKAKIANLQARIDQLHASIQAAGGSVQSEGPLNRYQAWQLQRAAQIQLQLDEQKRKLDQMQDSARHAGMHTAVYDP